MYNFYTDIFVQPSGSAVKKILLVMKLTTFLMITSILQVSARAVSQKVTLFEKNAPLTEVFNQISIQTGFDFAFTAATLRDAKSVSINVKNADLDDVLQRIFNGQPFDYSIEEKSVVISRKELSLLDNLKNKTAKLLNLPGTISGTVSDSLYHPLIGANVSLKGTNYNTVTDHGGSFTFHSIPQGKYTLVISYVGYERVEKQIIVEGTEITLFFVVNPSISSLDQVQVIGYGTESKRFRVGSSSTVTAEQMEKQPVTNPLLTLEGQAPGLAITATHGVPGSTVWCRCVDKTH